MKTYKLEIKQIIFLVGIVFLLFLSAFAFTEEEPTKVVSEEKENKKEYLEDAVKQLTSFEGYIKTYQDPKTSNLYFSLTKEQLNQEFIYFAHELSEWMHQNIQKAISCLKLDLTIERCYWY